MVAEQVRAPGKVACNFSPFITSHDDCNGAHHDSWSNELNEKPKLSVIDLENRCYEFADRMRVKTKRPAASGRRLNTTVFLLNMEVRTPRRIELPIRQLGS